jgi:hypothetical protein
MIDCPPNITSGQTRSRRRARSSEVCPARGSPWCAGVNGHMWGALRLSGMTHMLAVCCETRSTRPSSPSTYCGKQANRSVASGNSIRLFAGGRLLCRLELGDQTLKALQELARGGVSEYEARSYDPPCLRLIASDRIVKSHVCERYNDITMYAADASNLVGENFFFVQRIFKLRFGWWCH